MPMPKPTIVCTCVQEIVGNPELSMHERQAALRKRAKEIEGIAELFSLLPDLSRSGSEPGPRAGE